MTNRTNRIVWKDRKWNDTRVEPKDIIIITSFGQFIEYVISETKKDRPSLKVLNGCKVTRHLCDGRKKEIMFGGNKGKDFGTLLNVTMDLWTKNETFNITFGSWKEVRGRENMVFIDGQTFGTRRVKVI